MAYSKTNWKAGDVVTSAKLNKIEKRIEENAVAVLECTIENGNVVIPMKASELYQGMQSKVFFLKYAQQNALDLVYSGSEEEGTYSFATYTYTGFTANTGDDYPVCPV